eukprot:650950-Rhodomonas_salina.1
MHCRARGAAMQCFGGARAGHVNKSTDSARVQLGGVHVGEVRVNVVASARVVGLRRHHLGLSLESNREEKKEGREIERRDQHGCAARWKE